MPFAHLSQACRFHGHDILVTRDCLVPRPFTEHLVDYATNTLTAKELHPPTVLELGTGTGAVLGSILRACPEARGVGTEARYGV